MKPNGSGNAMAMPMAKKLFKIKHTVRFKINRNEKFSLLGFYDFLPFILCTNPVIIPVS